MMRSAGTSRPARAPHAASVARLIEDVFVMTRNGTARRRSSSSAATRLRQRLVAHDEHAVEIEEQAADAAKRAGQVDSRAGAHGSSMRLMSSPGLSVRRRLRDDPDLRRAPTGVALVCVHSASGGANGTARRQEGAHLRRRERSLDRVGHRPGLPRAGREGRLFVRRIRSSRSACGRSQTSLGSDVRRAVRRPGRRPDRARLPMRGPPARARSTSSSMRSPSRSARSSTASSRRPRGTASTSRWTSAPTRWSRWSARRGR